LYVTNHLKGVRVLLFEHSRIFEMMKRRHVAHFCIYLFVLNSRTTNGEQLSIVFEQKNQFQLNKSFTRKSVENINLNYVACWSRWEERHGSRFGKLFYYVLRWI